MKHFCLRDASGEDHGVHRNFSSRKCVLKKKWNVKMNPAASNASSECTTSAMLIIHPGMNRVKNTGYYITVIYIL